MRPGLLIVVAALLLAGCSAQRVDSERPSLQPLQASSREASSGADVPNNNVSIPAADSIGWTPDRAALALADAANSREWSALYSMYATPTPDLDTATREWVEAGERYRGFRVLEVRVSAPAAAFVRVAYEVDASPITGPAHSVNVEDPGEWWPLHKVDGRWKIQWLPRQ